MHQAVTEIFAAQLDRHPLKEDITEAPGLPA
jgi:hypothetical protein